MANGDSHTTVMIDGSWDFSGGVDSNKVTTIQSALNPNGLARNELAWMDNCTVRDGGILQRTGFQPLARLLDSGFFYQGGFLYEPTTNDYPYFIFVISGRIYRYDPTSGVANDLSSNYGITLPITDKCFFCQGEEFLVIQAGDGVTLPLFWDGNILRQSLGLGVPAANRELPAATAMTYYMGRIWYAQGRYYTAGDIVQGTSGTLAYNFRDSILHVTENPLAIGGDGFFVPNNAGNIRALDFEINLDAALGQGRLLIFTRKAIYALSVPVTRADWTTAGNNAQPLQVVVQFSGTVSERSIVSVNADKFFQQLDPSIRSYLTATRYFNQWGNKSVSSNINRILQFNDRSLMQYSSGIEFENRMIQAVLPENTASGVVHRAYVVMDFEPISNLKSTIQGGAYPVWEGHYEGLPTFQLFSGDFGGRPRAFAAAISELDGSFNVWELTDYSRFENGDNRITWYAEFPAFTWGKEYEMKKLAACELWIDKVFGTVFLQVYYRPDADSCWTFWDETEFCSARNCLEDTTQPCGYPIQDFREGDRFPIMFGDPTDECNVNNRRPSKTAFQFQVKVVVKGWCRIRGIMLYAEPKTTSLSELLTPC